MKEDLAKALDPKPRLVDGGVHIKPEDLARSENPKGNGALAIVDDVVLGGGPHDDVCGMGVPTVGDSEKGKEDGVDGGW